MTSDVLKVASLIANNTLSEDPRIKHIYARHVVSSGVDGTSLQIPSSIGSPWSRDESHHAFFCFGNLAITQWFDSFRSLIIGFRV